jgi:hypothetical protein
MKPDAPVQHDDATAREQYGDVSDPKATQDPSSPQGAFWHPEDRDRVAAEITEAPLEEDSEDRHGEERETT